MPVEVALASEFRYCDPIVDENTLVVVISQSGETLDTLAAMREAKRLGARTAVHRQCGGLLHRPGGGRRALHLGRAGDRRGHHQGLLHPAGAAWTCWACISPTCWARWTPAEYDAHRGRAEAAAGQDGSRSWPTREDIQYYASIYFNHDSIFFIGRNIDYAVGLEGSLKLKEISYIHSEAYAAGELKHGTISLIEDGHPGGGPGQLRHAL